MLSKLKPSGSLTGSILNRAVQKAKNMYKSEEIAYQGAILAHVRTQLLPYLQAATRENELEKLPDADAEGRIVQEAYDYVNDLYTDEHLIMTQADLLEQLHCKSHLSS